MRLNKTLSALCAAVMALGSFGYELPAVTVTAANACGCTESNCENWDKESGQCGCGCNDKAALRAELLYMDNDRSVATNDGSTFETIPTYVDLNGSGTYSITLDAKKLYPDVDDISIEGSEIFLIDIPHMYEGGYDVYGNKDDDGFFDENGNNWTWESVREPLYPDFKMTVDSITIDGRPLDFDPSKFRTGNLVPTMSKYRLEIFNYFEESFEDPALDVYDISGNTLVVTFTVSGLEKRRCTCESGQSAEEYGLFTDNKLKYRTKEEIIEYVNDHWIYTDRTGTFSPDYMTVEPVYSGGYREGEISLGSQVFGINALNSARFVAGLDEVKLNAEYGKAAQAAAHCNAAVGQMTHTPAQDEDVPDDVYELGYKGAGSSNLGTNYSSLAQAVLFGWLEDADNTNVDRVGHRRWALNPAMAETGFGRAGRYTAMYAHDMTNSNAGYTVAWPAPNMPVEFFGVAASTSARGYYPVWSLSKNTAFTDKATVTLTRKSDGRQWNFSTSGSDGELYVSNENMGQRGCLIFRPSDIKSYSSGDSFNVLVKDGTYKLTYDVDFFSLAESGAGVQPTNTERDKYKITRNHAPDNTAPALVSVLFEGTVTDTLYTAMDEFRIPYSIPGGKCTVTVSCENYVTRKYETEVKHSNLTEDPGISINLTGDISGDGKITSTDLLKAKSHIKGVTVLEGYELDCADADANGKVNSADLLKLKAHMKGVTPLW